MATLPVRPRERKGDRTRARLLEAALEEFREHGVAGASIARISAAAGLARSAFYFHFPTKADALREVRHLFEEQYAARIGEGDDLDTVLASLVDGILDARAAVGNPAVFGEMLALETDPSTSMTDDSVAAATLVDRFTLASKRGELRRGLEPQHAAYLCLRAIFGCLVGGGRNEKDCRRDLSAITSLFRENGENR